MTKEKFNIHQNKHYWQISVSKRKNKTLLYTIMIYTLFLRVTLLNISKFMGENGFLRLLYVSSFSSKLHNVIWCIFLGKWLPSSYTTHIDVRWWTIGGVGWLWEVCSSRNKAVAKRLLMEISSGRPVHPLCQNTTCSSKFPSNYHHYSIICRYFCLNNFLEHIYLFSKFGPLERRKKCARWTMWILSIKIK